MDALLRSVPGRKAGSKFGRAAVKHALRKTLEEVRREAGGGRPVDDVEVILARAFRAAARDYYGISDVINATGVLLHTGLGRAPLPTRAAEAAARISEGYCDLEVDRETGERGRRTSRAEALLAALTGAEDALVVNNNAASLLLALAALARDKEVIVSRGELIEIGGEFRLPEIMAASGAEMVEVGTTNRTRTSDYERAIGSRSALILKVHPSNYRVTGFAAAVPLPDLAALARASGLPLLYDVGSGLLQPYPEVPGEEPSVSDAVSAGADLVCFSGDKLLGGPQAGVVVGRKPLVDELRRHPIARAVRVDKMTVATLEAVLRMYATDRRGEIPLWRLLSEPAAALMERAEALASVLPQASARQSEAALGGGALPGFAVPSAEVVLSVPDPPSMLARLRSSRPPVFCRTEKDSVAFDLRTVPAEKDDRLIRSIRYALEQG